jgi:hypothetical protein
VSARVSPLTHRFAIFFLAILSVLGFALFLRALGPNTTASDADLKRGAEKFAALIQTKDSAALLGLFSEQGASFISGTYAVPKAEYSLAEIRKDFESKAGVYCIFFDTECLSRADAKERARQKGRPLKITLKSVLDLLDAAKEKRFVTYDISAANGKVTLLLSSRTADTAVLGDDALNFYFRQENGEWKLRNIEFQ